jgi:hypothetical protein
MYFEWAQNRAGYLWKEAEVNEKFEDFLLFEFASFDFAPLRVAPLRMTQMGLRMTQWSSGRHAGALGAHQSGEPRQRINVRP